MNTNQQNDQPNQDIFFFPVFLTAIALLAASTIYRALKAHSVWHGIGGILLAVIAVWMFQLLAKTKAIGKSMLGKFANGYIVSGGLMLLYGLFSFTFELSPIYGVVPPSHGIEIMGFGLVLACIGLPIKFMAIMVGEARRQEQLNQKSNNRLQAIDAKASKPDP